MGLTRNQDLGQFVPGNGTAGSFASPVLHDADFGGLSRTSTKAEARIAKTVQLMRHDPLPELPEGIAAPDVHIGFDGGPRTYFTFGDDTFFEVWELGDEMYNSIDDYDERRGRSWPDTWSAEQIDGVREYATKFAQNVEADVYAVTTATVSGATSDSIIANVRGTTPANDDSQPAGDRAAERASKILDVWVDTRDEGLAVGLSDALADLRHWAAANQVSMQDALTDSANRFDDEVRHPF